MDREEIIILSASLIAFVAISGVIIAVGMEIERRKSAGGRLKDSPQSNNKLSDAKISLEKDLIERLSQKVDMDLLSGLISEEKRTKLRVDLIRAGFFDPKAPAIFIGVTIITICLCAVVAAFNINYFLADMPIFIQLAILIVSTYAGYFIPDAYLRSRLTKTKQEYISVFPDFLDLLVVCVDAGLSLNAALDRVTNEFYSRSKPLATNFGAMLQEVRIGREMEDALDNLSFRTDADEIRSFGTLLKQSIELGSDVSDALRVYSEEMRVKRMFRAEEEANKLPVKMLLPLGLFIFPVILIVIMAPIVVRISNMGK